MCRDAWLASGPGYLCSLAAGSVYLYGSLEHKKLVRHHFSNFNLLFLLSQTEAFARLVLYMPCYIIIPL